MKHLIRWVAALVLTVLIIHPFWAYDSNSASISEDHGLLASTREHHEKLNLLQKPFLEPATMFLIGTGLIGLAVLGRKKIKK